MDALLLNKQLKENHADLEEFYNDLKKWGKDSVEKKNPIKKKQKSKENVKNKQLDDKINNKLTSNRGSTTDYSAWEKYNADAECEKLDENDNESDLTDECDENLREEAMLHKEKGNKLVKQQKWDEAIKYYNKAIDCFSFEPVFYANRALCFIKLNNMSKAESDCSLSLKLDKTYVKAYQRRAAAREVLNKLDEAEQDLLKVLEYEPNNRESKNALKELREKIKLKEKSNEQEQRIKSKFSNERKSKQSQRIDKIKPSTLWNSDNSDIILVKPINKLPHLRSKAPLKHIEINEKKLHSTNNTPVTETIQPFPKVNQNPTIIKSDDLKIIEKIPLNSDNKLKIEKKIDKKLNDKAICDIDLESPKTSVQFYTVWKQLSNDRKYHYLKMIIPKNITNIFKESMESNVFNEIVEILAEYFIKHNDNIYDWLLMLTEIKRFSTIIMFMNENDKKNIWKLINNLKTQENIKNEDIKALIEKYEL